MKKNVPVIKKGEKNNDQAGPRSQCFDQGQRNANGCKRNAALSIVRVRAPLLPQQQTAAQAMALDQLGIMHLVSVGSAQI